MRVSVLTDARRGSITWTSAYMQVDLAPHPVVSFVLQVVDAEKFPQVFRFNRDISLFTQIASALRFNRDISLFKQIASLSPLAV